MNTSLSFLLASLFIVAARGLAPIINEPSVKVETFAGNGKRGHVDANGTNAQFDYPTAIALDDSGNVFVSDNALFPSPPAPGRVAIRKIDPSGSVTTFFRRANGYVRFDRLAFVQGTLYGSPGQASIYKIHGGDSYEDARFGIFGDLGDMANWGENGILVLNLRFGTIHQILGADAVTFAGSRSLGRNDGRGTSASFAKLASISIGPGNVAYILDGNQIRAMTSDAYVKTIAGDTSTSGYYDGKATLALFRDPQSIATDAAGNIFIADTGNNAIRMLSPDGSVKTLAGRLRGFADGDGSSAMFSSPKDIAVGKDGTIYVADTENHSIRKITYRPKPPLPPNTISGKMFFGVQLSGPYGTKYRIETAKNADGPWSSYVTLTLSYGNPTGDIWIDPNPAPDRRFYRAVLLP